MLLNDDGVTLKLKKCEFFTNRIYYLRYLIRPRGLEVSLQTIGTDTILGLQAPSNITQSRSVVGLCNVFQSLVPNFALLAASLNYKLRKDQPPVYTELPDK